MILVISRRQLRLAHGGAVTIDERPRLETEQQAVLGPLVRVIEEAADEQPWALGGAAGDPPTRRARDLQQPRVRHDRRGRPRPGGDARRLHHLGARRPRRGCPLAVPARPSAGLRPRQPHLPRRLRLALPARDPLALGRPRTRRGRRRQRALDTPRVELLLAVVLGNEERVEAHQRAHARTRHDGRLLTRLLREGRVEGDTEEAVWAVIET